jgi:KUP system potassium uptake protein
MARDLVAQIELVVSRSCATARRPSAELSALQAACASQTVYVLGKEVMRIHRGAGGGVVGMLRKVVLRMFLWLRENSRAKLADLDIDADRLIEVGFVKDI